MEGATEIKQVWKVKGRKAMKVEWEGERGREMERQKGRRGTRPSPV